MKQTAVKILSSLIIFSFLLSYAEIYVPIGVCGAYGSFGKKCPNCKGASCCCSMERSPANDPMCSSKDFQKNMSASSSMRSFRQLNCSPITDLPTLAFNKDASHFLIISETVLSVTSIEYSDHYKSFIPEEIIFSVFHPPAA